jgi:nucleoside-diphosphate-sugar epimerase
MRVLVTGHKGYIGAVLVPLLQSRGHEVIGLDSDLYRRCTFGNGMPECPSLEKDVRDVELTDLRGVEAVIHLAALSNDPLGDLDPELTLEINHRASVRLAELARKAGVRRFLFSSSCSIYGASGDQMVDESGEFRPVTPYGLSKMLVERDVSQLATDSFSPVFLRNATVYGLSPRIRFDLVLNNLVAWAFTTGKVFLKSDGTPWRPIVHVEDVCLAFAYLLEAPQERVHNEAFNVGRTEENYRIRDLADIVKDTVPNAQIEFSGEAGPDKRCYRVNCDKILRTIPTFRPKWTAREGARQLYEAYRRYGLALEEFEGPRYKRIDHVKWLLSTGQLDSSLRWNNGLAS